MLEEEIGKEKILKIKEKGYKTLIITTKNKFSIYDGQFNEMDLFINKELNDEELKKLIENNEISKICDYILKVTRKKLFTSVRLRNKALKKFNDKELVDKTIDYLISVKIIDDYKFCMLAKAEFDLLLYGKYSIINYYIKEKIDENIIKEVLFDRENEKKKANDFFLSIKNLYISSNTLKAKKHISTSLLNRGFELDIIEEIMNNLQVDHENELRLLKKDAHKIKNKLSSKYDDFTLKNKLITKLIKIGYSYQDINSYLNEEDIRND